MGRKGWRVSRAFRVLLACVALWLPAPSASASFAPADAVVMVARGATAAAPVRARGTGVPSEERRRADARGAHRAPAQAALVAQRRERPFIPPTTTASRAVAAPLYLLHCALLR
ncbi:MAG TPA: hypothetical protein VK550_05010 [Polyangiaceae bacterium]|nr:hypothetical protein [Polyangiaceae bacterium]